MNFIQPSIDPVIISFGFVDIRWYSLAYILGLIIGLAIMKRLNKFSNNCKITKTIESFATKFINFFPVVPRKSKKNSSKFNHLY